MPTKQGRVREMTDYAEEIRKQMLDLWGKTVSQLEDISKSLMGTGGLEKIKLEQAKLAAERDKLVKRLGEEVVKLIDAGKLKVPKPVMKLYDRLEQVAARMTKKGKGKKKTSKKPAKKSTRKPAKKAKKKVTRKKAAKKAE